MPPMGTPVDPARKKRHLQTTLSRSISPGRYLSHLKSSPREARIQFLELEQGALRELRADKCDEE
ncbi:hypothetical protein M430DRAFT_14544 [Amorphotheca resinae ATCC 22711]|uniref:Uncharacterized protein n=1 Tax=Amorphotheca resinae ATCC 22711 TaxID=857342 RepID=A0A2T3BD49_AMORE|nr:hypothetical protein M430DRAFT_14544 [Amorphotheca resinae ATCC 22711]PSS27258.1 hypothetical protein M430DRAFT_14544 [Amorphotheca resinae ATCC 22711]